MEGGYPLSRAGNFFLERGSAGGMRMEKGEGTDDGSKQYGTKMSQ